MELPFEQEALISDFAVEEKILERLEREDSEGN